MENKNFNFYANLTPEQIFTELQTSEKGLLDQEAQARIALYGPNQIAQQAMTWIALLKNQFSNPFMFMLLIVAFIYFFTHQYNEGIILLGIIVVNVAIGFYQEYQSSKAMVLLQSYVQQLVTVRRAGVEVAIVASQIVPGDLIVLKAGDIIAADCRLIASKNLIIDESSLTGEFLSIKKTHEIPGQPITQLYDAVNCCFAGAVVVDGFGMAVVFATGSATQFGAIALLTTARPTKSNLTKGTMHLAQIVLLFVIISLIIVFVINMFVERELVSWIDFMLFSAALAITAIPSALPIVITFCLTRGAMALHKHKIIVKRLSAIEDLGSIEVLCTDKTGTLTENALTVNAVYPVENNNAIVYAAIGTSVAAQAVIAQSFDGAIVQTLTSEQLSMVNGYTVIQQLPFTYERHRSIVYARNDSGGIVVTKGSAEYIIDKCTGLKPADIDSYNEWIKNNELGGNRVLAIATKTVPGAVVKSDDAMSELDTTYETILLIAFSDTLKPTAHTAITKAQELGVQIKVLSGDSAYVCFTIAQQLGLESNINNVVHGVDFERSTEEQKMFLVHNRTVFARVTPQQKYQIVVYLQRNYSVGYMGDGINDAPALKTAHVGIVVNDAAPIAREAAEIIMLQKSLLNVVLGIEEGRKVIVNTIKYITITISSNLGNFYSLAFSSLLINYLPMLPLQLLFLDLITDFPLIAISTDHVSSSEIKKPISYSAKDVYITFLLGLISSPFDFMVFVLFRHHPATLQTNWFIASALTQLALVFSVRTRRLFCRSPYPSLSLIVLSLLAIVVVVGLPFTDFGQRIFLFVRPAFIDLLKVGGIAVAYFVTTETVKLIYYRTQGSK